MYYMQWYKYNHSLHTVFFYFSKPVLDRTCSLTNTKGATVVYNLFSFILAIHILRLRQQSSLHALNSGTYRQVFESRQNFHKMQQINNSTEIWKTFVTIYFCYCEIFN